MDACSLHVCLYVYMYLRAYVCIDLCMYVCTHVCTYIYLKGLRPGTAAVPLGAGTVGHYTRISCKCTESCGIPVGIPAGFCAQQFE